MLNGVKPSTDASLYLMMMKDIYSPYTARMLSGLGINEVAVLSKDFHLFGLEKFDPKRMPAGYKLLSKQDDGYIYEVVAEPTKVFPLYYYNFSGPSDLEDGVVWTSMLRSSAQIQLVNKGEGKDYAFSMDILNPGNSGTLSVTMDGNSLGSVQVGPGNGSFRLQDIFIPSGKHELEFSWSGEPTKVDGTPFNIKGSFDTYLLFSRVALESTGSGNGR
jgi:hypothetical protein